MRNKAINRIAAIIFCSSCILNLRGQELNIPEYIRQRYESYCSTVPWEEVFIHTDKHEYISGEKLWFKAYLINRQSMSPSLHTKLLYIELLNIYNKPVIQQKYPLNSGAGAGMFLLPDTLSSGEYVIRAYTNWMKNFSPYNCYHGKINIYNSATPGKNFPRIKSIIAPEIKKYERYDKPGISLNIKNYENEIHLNIHSDETFRRNNDSIVYLMIHSHGVINSLTTKRIAGNKNNIILKKNMLSSGVNQITIFDLKGPICDKYFIMHSEPENSLQLKGNISSGRREKIILEILSEDSSLLPDLSNLSISVSIDSMINRNNNIVDYLIFGSEFGFYPADFLNGRNINELRLDELDIMMENLQSNWILWDSIFSPDSLYFKYKPEYEMHYIPGKLTDANLKPVNAGKFALISYLKEIPDFSYAETDSKGNFNIGLDIHSEHKKLVIQPDEKTCKVFLESPFMQISYENEIKYDSLIIPKHVAMQALYYQINKIYGLSNYEELNSISNDKSYRFYGKPDYEINMNNYIKLDSMQEVFFELVPNVTFKNSNNGYELFIIDQFRNRIEGTPCIMINGIIIKDLKILGNMDPAIVTKIDVVASKYRVGNYVFNGIINLITKDDYFITNFLDNTINLSYNILSPQFSFKAPDYYTATELNNAIPDFRSTLYWNNNLINNKDGYKRVEFWSSDVRSEYNLNIQGLDRNANYVFLNMKFSVD